MPASFAALVLAGGAFAALALAGGHLRALPVGGGPHPDHRVTGRVTVQREVLLGDLQHDGVDVVAGQGVVTGFLQVAAVEQVEDPKVQEERVRRLPGERPAAARQGHQGLLAQRGVVRHGRLADIGRCRGRVLDQCLLAAVGVGGGQGVGLTEVQRRVAEVVHDPGVVQELAGVVADVVAEGPGIGDVGLAGALAVDLDVVLGVVRERVEVRAAVWLLERDPVRHQGDHVRVVRAGEGVDVGVVGFRVARDQGGLAVAGGGADAGRETRDGGGRHQGDRPQGRQGAFGRARRETKARQAKVTHGPSVSDR